MHSENLHEDRPVPARGWRADWSRLIASAASLIADQIVEASIMYAQAMHPELLYTQPPEPEPPAAAAKPAERQRRHLRVVAR